MKHYLALTLLCLPMVSLANDSTGFVGTGGIQYLKSPHIAMQTEDLFISKTQIRVDYQFKNLSQHDITETILFPLPRVDDIEDSFDIVSDNDENGNEVKYLDRKLIVKNIENKDRHNF